MQITKFNELADPRRPLYLTDAFSVPLKTHPEYEQRTKTILPEQGNIETAQKAQDYPFHNYLDRGLYTAPARALSGVARECSD